MVRRLSDMAHIRRAVRLTVHLIVFSGKRALFSCDDIGMRRATNTCFPAFSRRTSAMLCKCANEACNTPFRRIREGKLFQVETEYFPSRGPSPTVSRKTRPLGRIEHYWLCDACSPFVTLTFDQSRGVITVPLPDGSGKKTVRVSRWTGSRRWQSSMTDLRNRRYTRCGDET